MTHGLLLPGNFWPPLSGRTVGVVTAGQQSRPSPPTAQTLAVGVTPFPQGDDWTDRQTLQTAQAHEWPSANIRLGVQRAHGSSTIAEHLSQAQAALASLVRLGQLGRLQRQLERERIWLATNRHRYAGRWIALDGDQLLAVGASAKEVFSEVANHVPAPLVIHIAEQELPFAGW